MSAERNELDRVLAQATKADLEAYIRISSAGRLADFAAQDLRGIIGRRKLDAIEARIAANDRAFTRATRRRADVERIAALRAKGDKLQQEWDSVLRWTYPDNRKAAQAVGS